MEGELLRDVQLLANRRREGERGRLLRVRYVYFRFIRLPRGAERIQMHLSVPEPQREAIQCVLRD